MIKMTLKSAVFVAALGILWVPGAGGAQAQLRSEVFVPGFSLPLGFVQDPTDPTVQFVVQQRGRIRPVVNGVLQAVDFLNLTGVVSSSGSERGLLGLAFAPDYATSRRFYVNFTDSAGNTVVSRFKRSEANPLVADPTTRFDFRWGGPTGPRFIVQPFSNHNGGHLLFGPDGYLYIGLGDGGSAGDPGHRAQNATTLLGKMLRIDVSVPDEDLEGYRIPPDNPFLDGDPVVALGEIWAFGLRNPWKYTFDEPAFGGTGALVIADVGQNIWEEIDYEPANRGARNYGWRNREGAHTFDTSLPPAYKPLIDPIFEYSHSLGASITGGFVYRGTILGSQFFGRYFFADFIAGRVWSIALTVDPITGEATASDFQEHTAALGGSGFLGNLSAFGVDSNGELYLVGYSGGRIIRIRAVVEVVTPQSLAIFRGVSKSGNLQSLFRSEDNRLVVRPGVTLNSQEAPVQLIVETTAPTAMTTELGFLLEASTSVSNIRQKIEMFDFTANAYEEVDSRIASTSDSVVEVTITANPLRFMEAGTRRMRARLSWKEAGPVVSYPWQARTDQAVWKIRMQ